MTSSDNDSVEMKETSYYSSLPIKNTRMGKMRSGTLAKQEYRKYNPKIRYKYSSGIALCRRNPRNNKVEVIIVKKRCTYWFTAFVLGMYWPNDDTRLLFMFSRMTPEEKLVILTLNFESMWNHTWQTHNENPKFKRKKIADYDFYREKRHKFERLTGDTGKRLRQLIAKSKNNSLIWEIPKGRKQFSHENDVECAIREFEEETNIKKESYKIIPDIKPFRLVHRDDNTIYISTYYIAKPIKPIRVRMNFDMLDQICEIIDIKWANEDEVRLLKCAQFQFIKKIFKTVRKKLK